MTHTDPPPDPSERLLAKPGEPEGDSEGEDELTDEEVLAILAPVASRLAASIGRVPGVRAEVLEVLRQDDTGARELLAAAFDSGREEAMRSALTRPEVGLGEGGEPDWSDVESVGERKALHVEQNICSRCSHVSVCRWTPPPEMLVVIRRCAAFRLE